MHEVQALDDSGAVIKVVAEVDSQKEADSIARQLNQRFQGVTVDGKRVNGYVVVSD